MKVLVFIEQRDGKLKSSSLEALTLGAKLAGSPADCAAVIVGKGVEGLAAQLQGYGCDTVHMADDASFDKYNPLAYAAAVEAAIKGHAAKIVVGVASPMGRDVFPRLAARFDAGILTDLTAIELAGDKLTGVKPMYAGKVLSKVAIQNSSVMFATVRPNVSTRSR